MKWYKKLYLGESIKQAKWVRFQIAFGKKTKRVLLYFLVKLPEKSPRYLSKPVFKNTGYEYGWNLYCWTGFR